MRRKYSENKGALVTTLAHFLLSSDDDGGANDKPGRRCVFCVDRDIDRDESLDRHVRANHKASGTG